MRDFKMAGEFGRKLNPPANRFFVPTVGFTELLAHVPLLGVDLKPIHTSDEDRNQHKACDIAQKDPPTDQHQQETEVHGVAAYSIDAANHKAGCLRWHSRIDGRTWRPKFQHAGQCKGDAG